MQEQGTNEKVGKWARPERLRCQHRYESGARCNGSTETGEKLCYTHKRYAEADPMYPVQVPPLEDTASIRFVITQTARQVALGAIPPANGRALLQACRQAQATLLFDLAVKRQSAEHRAQSTGSDPRGLPAASGRLPVSDPGELPASSGQLPAAGEAVAEGDGPVVEEELAPAMAAEAEQGSEHSAQRSGEERTERDAEPQPEPEHDSEQEPRPFLGVRPSFPDLRQQWDRALEKTASEIGANLSRREDETAAEWIERSRGPIHAGHPQTRRVVPATLSTSDLPFNPKMPPAWSEEIMDSWRESDIAAWYRCLVPEATQKETEDFARPLWGAMHADRVAAYPAECCVFRGMTAEEIAAWYRALLPTATAGEAEIYGTERARLLQGH